MVVMFWGAVVLAALLTLARLYGRYQRDVEAINHDIEWWVAYHERLRVEDGEYRD